MVRDDATVNMDNGKVTALALIDLSAAFDTNDHNIYMCGRSSIALHRFSSFLVDSKDFQLHSPFLVVFPRILFGVQFF